MPGPVTDARAGALRDRYVAQFGGAELPVPVEQIAEDLVGLSVAESEELHVSGLLLPAEREIWLNAGEARESPGRRRFTIAHEVGHWVCQCLEGRVAPIFCRSTDVGVGEGRRLEREANVFAAELLMPEPLVRDEFPRAASVGELADWFGVSEEAMAWRLYNFRLIEERPERA
jgi:IrrE N-terminal-like domain